MRVDEVMPLLAREPTGYPDNLFESDTFGLRQWWVFQTRARAEKAFARMLRKFDTAHFLPQYIHSWRKNGREFRSSLPLFPGYIFASGGESVRETAFATNLIVREVPVPDQAQLDRELGSISCLLGGDGSMRPEEGITRGSRVLIVEGIYSGINGRVIEAVGNEELRVGVEVSLLGRGVSVVVERWMIKILEPSPV
jgi:transcription antitermination factor NusG